MQVQVKRWGNSLGVRIPKGLADVVGIKADDVIEIEPSENGFTVKKARKKYDLKELLSRVTPENKHDPIDFGGPKGREVL